MKAIKYSFILLLLLLASACTQKFIYLGNELALYEVPLSNGAIHDLALVKGARSESTFIDPDRSNLAMIEWNGSWRSLSSTPAFRKLMILNFAPRVRPWIVGLLWILSSVLISLIFSLVIRTKLGELILKGILSSSTRTRGEWVDARTGRKIRDATPEEMAGRNLRSGGLEKYSSSGNNLFIFLGAALSLLIPILFIFTQKVHLIPFWSGIILSVISLLLSLFIMGAFRGKRIR